jgi:AraC-like DNA-binding protein
MIFGNMSHMTVKKLILVKMTSILRHFAKWKNRSKDSSSNSSSSKALVRRQFTENWPPYWSLQLTHYLKSKSRANFSRRAIFLPRPNQAPSPPHVLGKALSDFLEEFPFVSAGIIAQNVGKSKSTLKQILKRELGLRRFSRRWVSH